VIRFLKCALATRDFCAHLHKEVSMGKMQQKSFAEVSVAKMQRNARMARELVLLQTQPPAGIAAWPEDESKAMTHLSASIRGPPDTPYENGEFKLSIVIPDRYPFEPPRCTFLTPVYHPNIDSAGRICLDTLKMPPKGSWTPSLNISTVLTTIQALLASPNPDDALVAEIVFYPLLCYYGSSEVLDQSDEFRRTPEVFFDKARKFTEEHASSSVSINSSTDATSKPHSQETQQTIMQSKGNGQILSAKRKRIPEEKTAQPAPPELTSAQPRAKVRKIGRI
jgi:ubiquitin-conjugating enzyme E2 T